MFQSFAVTIIMHKERDPLELEAVRTGIKDMSFLLGILIMIIPNSNYRAFSYLNGQLCDRSTLSQIIRPSFVVEGGTDSRVSGCRLEKYSNGTRFNWWS